MTRATELSILMHSLKLMKQEMLPFQVFAFLMDNSTIYRHIKIIERQNLEIKIEPRVVGIATVLFSNHRLGSKCI